MAAGFSFNCNFDRIENTRLAIDKDLPRFGRTVDVVGSEAIRHLRLELVPKGSRDGLPCADNGSDCSKLRGQICYWA